MTARRSYARVLPGSRGRGRGRGSLSNSSWSSPSLPSDRNILEGLNVPILENLPVPSNNPSDEGLLIDDVQYIGSYNWLKTSTPQSPAILVPGSPPIWTEKPIPFQVNADQGPVYIDSSGVFLSTEPHLALMVAVENVQDNSPFDWSSVDFITDRNSLRKLLKWVGGTSDKEFRIDTQLAGDTTVLLNRWEKRNQEASGGFTFGFSFEEATTKTAKGCEGTTGYHRIVTYDLDGLKMVVRFEVDACVAQNETSASGSRLKSDIDELTQMLSNVSVAEPKTTVTIPLSRNRTLTVKRGGQPVPQNSLLELATVSHKRLDAYDWDHHFPQLYVSNTPQHYLGVHDRGRFIEYQKRRTSEMKGDIARVSKNLRKLKNLLETIQEIVVEHGKSGRLSLVRVGTGIDVYNRSSQASCLPEAYMKKFEV